jgi:ribonuclease HI
MVIYTDGSCSGNPGAGGWAAILVLDNEIKTLQGQIKFTTNNRMELYAIIRALRFIMLKKLYKKSNQVTIYTDSSYVVNGVTYLPRWKAKKFDQVKNPDLWKAFYVLLEHCKNKEFEINIVKIKRDTVELHKMADKIARQFSRKYARG